ncbi:uncharacterized protein LOC104899425 isoform X4 [Beta vulgaris subsp. vulgaris]|uniref:uncharacterized protein LOC104899425 isoform X4 n=1 Tax=Beta vulgaris subsp. vulgaris TaxID=3555 RepID=UPI0005400A61|nr:uncharacterized protein LOC104899425 isoform X4 [Beta vulgaris subsp. vulgaris]
MENGGLSEKFGELSIENAKDHSLLQVIKAVEVAEDTIREQYEENNRLKAELLKRNQELENLKLDKPIAQIFYSGNSSDEHRQGTNMVHQAAQIYDTSGGQTAENATFSHPASPALYSPGRFSKDGQYDPSNGPVQRLMQVTESNNHNNLWKQIREREEEIIQLRKHLNDYSIKEAQIRNEKYVLDKRIAHMRMAFDQQQQDLVDAASKALSYRQDIIEENVRLSYALQDVQQERTTFVTSLLPLLAEYSLQPQVSDAQSIVSNIKILFRHLHEKLNITEAKLKESQYQLTPWRSGGTSPNFAAQSPEDPSDAAFASRKVGLELVPRPSYSPANMANSDGQIAADWNSRGQHAAQAGATTAVLQNAELDNMGRYSPLVSRDLDVHDAPTQAPVSHEEMQITHNRQVKFKDPVSSSELYGAAAEGQHNENEDTGTWGLGTSPYSNTLEDQNSSYSRYLQPVPEEPSSSFSEAADDDPLPAIEDLQISGEPYPGQEIQACGYSTNGTTSCNFEWVRHLEDGSVKYIDGAKQPVYLITADDVESYLAIEVQPLDDRKRKGELVKVFANEHRKITCDPVMQSHIEENLRNGHASYKVSVSTGYLDIWEPATLTIKREGYSIKGSGSSSIVVNEKFVPGTTVTITHGNVIDFSVFGPSDVVHLLRAENTVPDIARLCRKEKEKGGGCSLASDGSVCWRFSLSLPCFIFWVKHKEMGLQKK